jgi:hypothetical protein
MCLDRSAASPKQIIEKLFSRVRRLQYSGHWSIPVRLTSQKAAGASEFAGRFPSKADQQQSAIKALRLQRRGPWFEPSTAHDAKDLVDGYFR